MAAPNRKTRSDELYRTRLLGEEQVVFKLKPILPTRCEAAHEAISNYPLVGVSTQMNDGQTAPIIHLGGCHWSIDFVMAQPASHK